MCVTDIGHDGKRRQCEMFSSSRDRGCARVHLHQSVMLHFWTRLDTVIGVLFLLTSFRPLGATATEESSRGLILNALTLGAGAAGVNVTLDECVWRKDQVEGGSSSGDGAGDLCPDNPAIKFYLYTSLGSPRREIDPRRRSPSALASAGWVQQHHTVLLIHGYGGGDNTIPIAILRDAYLSRGDFNVIMVDWGALAPLPCYPAAVHNSAHVARCAAIIPRMLRDAGAPADAWTCVGHSLGAHVCGAMADYLTFRVHKIIGLDPARPLVRAGARFRLDPSDAAVVHVIHTDAGHYGDTGRLGTLDFCVNGGRTQPHCRFATKGEHLCNHISAVCFFAESLDPSASLTAEPCSRRCLAVRLRPGLASRDTNQQGGPIQMGPYSPDGASGTYCANSLHQPYCPRKAGDRGHLKCCVGSGGSSNAKPEKEPTDAPGVVDEPLPAAQSRSSEDVANLSSRSTLLLSAQDPIIATDERSQVATIANRVTDAHDVGSSGVVLVLPSTDISAPTSTTTPSPKESPVFPVYSTVADTETGPVLLVMATPVKTPSQNTSQDNAIEFKSVTKPYRPSSTPSSSHLLPSPKPFSTPASFFQVSDSLFRVEPSMSDMLSPKPTSHSLPPPHTRMPISFAMTLASPLGEPIMSSAAVPISPPPSPQSGVAIPGAPDDGDSPIPMAGSLTGPWVPMVMLPPTPFSTDSWNIRASGKIMAPVRRSTFRNYIYE